MSLFRRTGLPLARWALLAAVAGGTVACRRGDGQAAAIGQPAGVSFKATAPASAPRIEDLHLLWDMTPPSASNPIIARVADYRLEIPASEFRAFLASEVPPARQEGRWRGTYEDKRRLLDRLLDDHLFLWEGYRQGADKTDGVVRQLQETEKLLLAEHLEEREGTDKAKTAAEHQRMKTSLRERLFNKATVTVSNEALAELRGAARTAAGSETSERTLALCSLPPATLTVTVGAFLDAYRRMPPDERPDLERKEAVVDILKQILEPELEAAEARALGLERSDKVRSLLQQNRNTIVRLWELDRLTAETVERTRRPDHEQRLRQWYQDQRSGRYTYRDAGGQLRTRELEKERESIQNDYFEHLVETVRAETLAALRRGRRIEVDEEFLRQMPVPAS